MHITFWDAHNALEGCNQERLTKELKMKRVEFVALQKTGENDGSIKTKETKIAVNQPADKVHYDSWNMFYTLSKKNPKIKKVNMTGVFS